MNIFFTGASGVIGAEVVPILIDAGHEVTAVARSDDDRAWLERLGATPVAADLFDADDVYLATEGAEAIVHFATAIPRMADMTKREAWTCNDRLRTTGTENLVNAAIAHGADVFVQEALTLIYADGGTAWLDENSAIDPPWTIIDSVLEAERHVERFTARGGRGVNLRLARLYGPGRASAELIGAVARRKLPVIGRGDNYVSSLHTHDAATALAASLTIPSGAYNVTDDEPVTAAVLQDSLSTALGVRRSRRVPVWVGRLAARDALPVVTVSQRVSNRRFREVAGWTPKYPSIVAGWETVAATAGAA
jgi:nucleoside-diphosphate-sugar epimerase